MTVIGTNFVTAKYCSIFLTEVINFILVKDVLIEKTLTFQQP
jgi:hypothetical protein